MNGSYAEVLVANGSGFLLMALVLHYSARTIRIGLLEDKIFNYMALCTMFLCVCETLAFCIDGQTFAGARIGNYLVNEVLYITDVLFSVLCALYADFKVYEDRVRLKRRAVPLSLPALVILVLILANPTIGWCFTVSDENVYARGSLFFLVYAVTYFYLFLGVLTIYFNRKRAGRYMYMPVIVFVLPVVLGSLLQIIFYGIATLWLSVAIGITSLYISVQSESFNLDRLTGVYSRRYLESYLDAIYRHGFRESRKNATIVGVMLDIDKFKSINDRFGHLVGDDALLQTGEILRSAADKTSFVARYGGDEFLIILRGKTEKEADALVERIHKQAAQFNDSTDKPYDLYFSIGYAVVDPTKIDKEGFLMRADTAMYAAKRQKAGMA